MPTVNNTLNINSKVIIDSETLLNILFNRFSKSLDNRKKFLSFISSGKIDFIITDVDFQCIFNILEINAGYAFAQDSMHEIQKQLRVIQLTKENIQEVRYLVGCNFLEALRIACVINGLADYVLVDDIQHSLDRYSESWMEAMPSTPWRNYLVDVETLSRFVFKEKLSLTTEAIRSLGQVLTNAQDFSQGWTTALNFLFQRDSNLADLPRSLDHSTTQEITIGSNYQFRINTVVHNLVLLVSLMPTTDGRKRAIVRLCTESMNQPLPEHLILLLISDHQVRLWDSSQESIDEQSKQLRYRLEKAIKLESGRCFRIHIACGDAFVETGMFCC